MTSPSIAHRRVHNLLLIQKLLTLREGASPFILILDSVEQSAKPLLRHYILNAKSSRITTVFLSYETLTPPAGVTHVIKARRKTTEAIQKEVSVLCSASKKTLLVLDTLHPLCTSLTTRLPTFLSALLSHPHTSLLAIYHLDIPLPSPLPPTSNPYAPSPLTLLKYSVTTIMTLHPLSYLHVQHLAGQKSLPSPVFGLDEDKEGVLVGIVPGRGRGEGLVLEMEYRRKSGRGISETFFLPFLPSSSSSASKPPQPILLDDHPLFLSPQTAEPVEDENGDLTFDLHLTDAQRKAREGVVLPYFDAQKEGGAGVGGRILFEMGSEDWGDFDDEEDEI